jgi:hypothetical protein
MIVYAPTRTATSARGAKGVPIPLLAAGGSGIVKRLEELDEGNS